MKNFAALCFAAAAFFAYAQTNNPRSDFSETISPKVQQSEQARTQCLAGRRIICGRILKILPGGLIIESGYADLLRPSLNASWLVSADAQIQHPPKTIESREPGTVCIGTVFLCDLPHARGPSAKPRPYDYVVLLGYSAGDFTYDSTGGIKKTVRRFSGDILKAVNLLQQNPGKPVAPSAQ